MSYKHEAEAQLTQERQALNRIEQTIALLLKKKLSLRAETTLALRSTQLAMMWLGKAKGVLGRPDPYPTSTDPTSKVIENRSDTADEVFLVAGHDETAHVKALRADLRSMEKAIENDLQILTDNPRWQACITNAYTNCCNATMWLGMVLNQIKTEADEKAAKQLAKTPVTPSVPSSTVTQPSLDAFTGKSNDVAADQSAKTAQATPGGEGIGARKTNRATPAEKPKKAKEETKKEEAQNGNESKTN